MAVGRPAAVEPVGSASTADLVRRASAQVSTLVRDEIALAKIELAEKAKRAGVGGGLVGGGAVLALYGLGLLFALVVVALDLVWPLWLAVLVVMAAVFAVAAIVVLAGTAQLKRAKPPAPSEAEVGLAADVDAVKSAVREGLRS